jgi:hypothetical protein
VPIACGDFLVRDIIQGQRLRQRGQMLVAPIAQQGAGDGGLVVLAGGVAPLGQRPRGARAGQDGADDREAGDPRAIADDVLQCDVQLREGFLPMLDVLGCIGQEHRALAEVTAQHTHVVGRPRYWQKVAPSQLDVAWACREALGEAGIFPIPRFCTGLGKNQHDPDIPVPSAA